MNAKNLVAIVLLVALAAGAAYFFWPRNTGGGTEDRTTAQITAKVRGIVGGLMTYSLGHDGKVPAPDQMSQTLVSAGHATQDLFTVENAKTTEPPFYGVKPKAAKPFADAPPGGEPLVYSNPALTPSGGSAVGYSDGHTAWLDAEAVKALLTATTGRTTPIK